MSYYITLNIYTGQFLLLNFSCNADNVCVVQSIKYDKVYIKSIYYIYIYQKRRNMSETSVMRQRKLIRKFNGTRVNEGTDF